MYSPKIHPRHLKGLYVLRESINQRAGKKVVTMITLVDEALDEYLAKKKKQISTASLEGTHTEAVRVLQ